LPSRTIRNKSPLLPGLRQIHLRPKLTSETEAQTLLPSIISVRLLPPRRARRPLRLLYKKAPLHHLSADIHARGLLYVVLQGLAVNDVRRGLLIVALILGGEMFLMWPPTMRPGVWYLSTGMLGLIGLFFGIGIVRLVFYVLAVVVASPGISIFLQLFADGLVHAPSLPLPSASSDLVWLGRPIDSVHSGNGICRRKRRRRAVKLRKGTEVGRSSRKWMILVTRELPFDSWIIIDANNRLYLSVPSVSLAIPLAPSFQFIVYLLSHFVQRRIPPSRFATPDIIPSCPPPRPPGRSTRFLSQRDCVVFLKPGDAARRSSARVNGTSDGLYALGLG
jgi:hypothetical protein